MEELNCKVVFTIPVGKGLPIYESVFWFDASGLPVMVNGNPTASGNRKVSLEKVDGTVTSRWVRSFFRKEVIDADV